MRSVVVVLPASMWAAMPILRVRSCGYCRWGELTDFFFSITASITDSILIYPQNLLSLSNKNAPRFTAVGAFKNLYFTSENGRMLCWPGPSYALHRACGWHSPVPDRLPESP